MSWNLHFAEFSINFSKAGSDSCFSWDKAGLFDRPNWITSSGIESGWT